jgi:hypothetical protein
MLKMGHFLHFVIFRPLDNQVFKVALRLASGGGVNT